MSTVKTNNAQIGQSATATNNFTMYQPASPDGTVRWGVGNSGSVTDIITLNSSGYAGVGTNSPNAKFAVQTSGADGINLMVDTAAPTQSCRLFLSNSTAGQSVALMNISGSLTFRYAATPGSGSGSEAMRIDTSGNVGIGTASPATKLDVNGTISVGGNKIVSNITTTNYLWAGSSQLYVVDSTGNTVISGMALGKTQILQGGTQSNGTGIAFPATQNASSDANTLDDYEEGTWTPTGYINCTVNSVSTAYYTKIGRQVTAYCYINITTSSAYFAISGLPFVSRGYGFAQPYYQIPEPTSPGYYIEDVQSYANFNTGSTVTNVGVMLYFSYFA